MTDSLFEDLDEDEEAEFDLCQCVNPSLCARHLVGQCDGHRIEINRAPQPSDPRELTGEMRFPHKIDKDIFDE